MPKLHIGIEVDARHLGNVLDALATVPRKQIGTVSIELPDSKAPPKNPPHADNGAAVDGFGGADVPSSPANFISLGSKKLIRKAAKNHTIAWRELEKLEREHGVGMVTRRQLGEAISAAVKSNAAPADIIRAMLKKGILVQRAPD